MEQLLRFIAPYTPMQVLAALGWLVLAASVLRWLLRALTPAKALETFESAGVLSSRQLSAVGLMIWGMCMVSAGVLTVHDFSFSIMPWVTALFGIGGVVNTAKAFANRKPAVVSTGQVTAEVKAENLNLSTAPTAPVGE